MPADYAFKGYENQIIADQIDSILATKLDINRFMTADYSLSEVPGMKKIIHKYTGTAVVDDLERGEGNEHFVDAEYDAIPYEVARTQGQAKWYDDDQMTDPTLIDAKLKYLSEGMVNNWTAKAIAEFGKSGNTYEYSNLDFADFADMISAYASVHESQEGLFFLVPMELIPTIRKTLNDNLKYTEAYIRTGAIGDVLGVPIYASKAVPEETLYLATNKAVTAFIKKSTFVEQDRDIDKKENFIVAARYSVIALTDESECVKCTKKA